MSGLLPLQTLLDDIEGLSVIVVDAHGVVTFVNQTYSRVLGMAKEEVEGRYIGDITPHSRTLIVLKTKKAIIGYDWSLNGYHMIGSAVPLVRDNQVLGCFAYSLFMDKWDAKDLVENLMVELNMYKQEVSQLYSARYTFSDIVGNGRAMRELKALAAKAATHPHLTVLLTGESGTSKELFAQAIHRASVRAQLPFIRVNCAAIPENLLEAELFGYEEGAFTGARKGGQPGKFELANGGTIFLDEIGELSLSMQSKLLVFLQEKVFERLGSHRPVRVNVRVVAATNRNLEQMVSQGRFREDLYYRLNVLALELPPLRERREDLPFLVHHLLPGINTDLGTGVAGVELLMAHTWPGNVRELVNVLERATVLAEMDGSPFIGRRQLAFLKVKEEPVSQAPDSLKALLRDYEKQVLEKSLQENDFNKTRAARALGIDLSSLYKKMRQHGIPTGPR
ncbi:MAG: sigma 54-interacting transcriptional regulator [Syntrophomonadaceae bacterium]|nr:sigma 54-interacting transcriptional regulator [Syntrophomonadaceae bacterium]